MATALVCSKGGGNAMSRVGKYMLGQCRGMGRLAMLLALVLLPSWHAAPSAAVVLPPPRCDWSDQDYDGFYSAPDLAGLTPEGLGEVLRVEHIWSYTPEKVAAAAGLESSAHGAEAYRILYLSQAPVGTLRAVSGLMVVPTGPIPAAGFPIVADGHGTVGLADVCAPSKSSLTVKDLLVWVARGYLVTATDYVGLGTPGLHPYVVGEAAAFSMLDGARAARRFCDADHGLPEPVGANLVILEGHSQGGHAALFAHQVWESYAPEMTVVGTVAFAPGSEIRRLAQDMFEHWSTLVGAGALAVYAYNQYYEDGDGLQRWLQEPYASQLPERAERQCLLGLSLWLGFKAERVYQPSMVTAVREQQWGLLQPWVDYLDRNTPGNYTSDVPVLVLQGEADPLVPPEVSRQLTRRLCARGTPATLSLYAGVGHSVPKHARPEALQWIADRLAGMPTTGSCDEVLFHTYLPSVKRGS